MFFYLEAALSFVKPFSVVISLYMKESLLLSLAYSFTNHISYSIFFPKILFPDKLTDNLHTGSNGLG